MDRRKFILTGLAGLAGGAIPGAALAETQAGEIRYNFGSAFSSKSKKKRRSSYGGKQIVSYLSLIHI